MLEGTTASVPPQGGRKHPHQEFLHIDTTNILFICGGAFEGLTSIIKRRLDTKTIGFDAELGVRNKQDDGETLKEVMPEDLVKFGLIPEFVGRVPIVVTLDGLNEEALVRILQEPKNSLIRQYTKLMELDGVELHFEEAAMHAIAHRAIELKTGARGLRAIMEKTMMDVMYETPSDDTIVSCTITEDAVTGDGEPDIKRGEPRPVPRRNRKAPKARKKTEPA